MDPIRPIYVSPKQAATLYNCSPQTIMKRIKRGLLPAIYLNRSAVRIKVTDLEHAFDPYNPERPRGDRRRKKVETQ